MAKETKIKFNSDASAQTKPSSKARYIRTAEGQISYEDAENCVNQMSESFPALTTKAHRLMRQVSGSFNTRTTKMMLIISIVINFLLAGALGTFVGMWINRSNNNNINNAMPYASQNSLHSAQKANIDLLSNFQDLKPLETNMKTCLPCSNFYDKEDVTVIVRSTNDICCTRDTQQELERTAQPILSWNFLNAKLDQLLSTCSTGLSRGHRLGLGGHEPLKDAAHLALDLAQTRTNFLNQAKTKIEYPIAWVTPADAGSHTFMGKGISYSSGRIMVSTAGLYYLYCKLAFSSISKAFSEKTRKIVISIQKNATTDLLRDVIYLNHNDIETSDLQGVVYLNAGDQVNVYTSYGSYLDKLIQGNVFGLFLYS